MSATVFNHIGPYTIERRLGSGGMGWVFLATDDRSQTPVALKLVPDGEDADAREILAAEQRGAELQQLFSEASQYVPRVYEVGFAPGYFYIAMEYIDGEDLSSVIRKGPVAPERAAAIAAQLCRFLEDVDRVEASETGPSRLTLLHNDLKPTNVRVVATDRVKVLDFGAAKALSLSRRVTRNDFGSIAYLSPECLETGERDRRTDAWALGVLLYEMVAGRAPFRADDTGRLEHLIRSRRPPPPPDAGPRALQAVIAKLLAPEPADRYDNAKAIREDLERYLAGTPTTAEADGWPGRIADEPPTRRTREPAVDEPPTRATSRGGSDGPEVVSNGAAAGAPPQRSKSWRVLRRALLVVGLFAAANEGCINLRADRLAATVPMQEFAGLTNVWTEYESLASRSYLGGLGVQELQQALVRQTMVLSERVIGNYRTPQPSVREAQWEAAATALRRALGAASNDAELRAALRYSEGHLRRIDGEAHKARRETTLAQRDFAEALTAFREAAALRPDWPDPFLGLARTFIYGLDDIDRGHDAINRAERLGYALGVRETAQLADGYRARAEALERAAANLSGIPQERELLSRSADAYRKALELYSKIADVADVPAHIRGTQLRLDRILRRLEGPPWE